MSILERFMKAQNILSTVKFRIGDVFAPTDESGPFFQEIELDYNDETAETANQYRYFNKSTIFEITIDENDVYYDLWSGRGRGDSVSTVKQSEGFLDKCQLVKRGQDQMRPTPNGFKIGDIVKPRNGSSPYKVIKMVYGGRKNGWLVYVKNDKNKTQIITSDRESCAKWSLWTPKPDLGGEIVLA